MASRRMLPTKFFKDPDVMALSTNDMRLILIGLVLNADDEGRELAHAKLLGRELDYQPEVIEQALSELDANGLISCYSVGKHRYYSLCRWSEWETLSKPTPSKYPPPPVELQGNTFLENVGIPHNPLGNPGNSEKIFVEGDDEGEGEGNKNRESRLDDENEAVSPSTNIVPFPLTHGDGVPTLEEQQIREITSQVASILKLVENEALLRIVADYAYDPTLSLLGEADAAREYIDDRQRNRNGTRMTPAFFRRWLKREREQSLQRQSHASAYSQTGTLSQQQPSQRSLPPSLMNLEAHYHDEARRAKA